MNQSELKQVRKIDCHVHLVGDGGSGSGCWFRLHSVAHRILARVILREAGIPVSAMETGLDVLYVERLVELVRQSSLDAVVLLAQDIPYGESGKGMPEKGGFFVPNTFLLKVTAKYPDLFLPAVSVHPGRPDAMEELERCLAAGARVLKLLPNCQNVDLASRRYRNFWERMAEGRMILLSHTGGELALPVLCPEFADPRLLRFPLEAGVTVIAAHCAGRSGLRDPDYTDILIAMFDQYPRLYGDNSALCSPVRCGTLPKLMAEPVRSRIIHGSDYPIPVGGFGPWRIGSLGWRDWRRARREANSLQRDYILKRAIGFPEDTFTRLSALLNRT